MTNAFWAEERRWRAGMLGEGTCRACFSAVATVTHRIHERDGIIQHLSWERARGRAPREQFDALGDGYAPLALCGLAPRLSTWQPVHGRRLQGDMGFDKGGMLYGDGSGVLQDNRDQRRATWSLWHDGGAHDAETSCTTTPSHM